MSAMRSKRSESQWNENFSSPKFAGMYFVRRKGRILYRLIRNGKIVPNLYTRDQLRLLDDKSKVRARQRRVSAAA